MHTGIPPSSLWLCVQLPRTRGTAYAKAQEVLRALSQLGVRIVLDDFGSGHISLDARNAPSTCPGGTPSSSAKVTWPSTWYASSRGLSIRAHRAAAGLPLLRATWRWAARS
ncbi:hypothetical protein [Mycobacterium tuberculosis]|uniref:hypothetical protein n=1 Tax=Mycobacterium tuberculosis TaxID=1773 RepID=UPI0035103D8E